MNRKGDLESRLICICFSKDRPLQLEAYIKSFIADCKGEFSLWILYTYSDSAYRDAYKKLSIRYDDVKFVEEVDFRRQTYSIVRDSDSHFIMFGCDDVIFKDKFNLSEIFFMLNHNKKVIGFLLRMGTNLDYCYSLNTNMSPPNFTDVDNGILLWKWYGQHADWGYPFELNASIYRKKHIIKMLAYFDSKDIDWGHPNKLEAHGFEYFKKKFENMLLACFINSKSLCLAINMCQNLYDNRAAKEQGYSLESLLKSWNNGYSLDLAYYKKLKNKSAHIEDFEMTKKFNSNNLKTPLVSVLMPVYNAQKYLREAIDSILGQTFTDFEFIIVNDGSTDSSREIIMSYKDSRIRLIENKRNLGLIESLNKALNYVRGKYVARMDADDISMPERFERQLMVIKDFETDICGTAVQSIDERGNYIGRLGPRDIVLEDIPASVFDNSTCILHPTVMMKSMCLRKMGGYNPIAAHVEDFDLWARLLAERYRAVVVPEELVKYRKHAQQICERFSDIQVKNDKKVIYNYILSIIVNKQKVKPEVLSNFFLRANSKFAECKNQHISLKDILYFRRMFNRKFSYINNSVIGFDKRIANSALYLAKDSHCSPKIRSEMTFVYLFANLSVYHHQGLLIKGIFVAFYKAVRRLYKFVKTKYHGGDIV